MSKAVLSNKLILIYLSILLCIYCYASTSINGQICSLWCFFIVVFFVMRADFLHPYIWHLGAVVLYYTAYPILYAIGYRHIYECTTEPLFIVSLCIFVFILIIPGYHLTETKDTNPIKNIYKTDTGINKTLLHIMTVVIVITTIAIRVLGFASKVEIYATNALLTGIITIVLIYINIYTLEYCSNLSTTNRIDVPILLEVIISSFAISIVTGERDLMFRMIVVTTLMLYSYKKIYKRQVILTILIFAFVLIPLSTKYKSFFLSGRITAGNEDNGIIGVFISFLTGDFESASRNLQIIVNHKETTYGLMQGSTFVSDILSVFGLSTNSGLRWFQDTFFAGRRTGMGFTIIGEGLINFGYIGAIAEYSLLSLFIRFLYKNHNNNIYYQYIYFSSIPIIMYSNRADFANILSPFVKHVLFSALAFHILKKIKAQKTT